MAQAEQYEILVLGSGEGGKLVAWHMANVPSTAATSWSRPDASPTPQGSILKTQVSSWTSAAMSVSMSVWALGECAGTPQFTHISEDDFRIVTENLAGGKRSTRNRLVPYCVTDPERSSHHPRSDAANAPASRRQARA
jgi:pyruvate/2-oxoglutarate dehydrogenase complex dihydrolipoamide dehydrogenase (E3) component